MLAKTAVSVLEAISGISMSSTYTRVLGPGPRSSSIGSKAMI